MTGGFRAFRVDRTGDRRYTRSVVERDVGDLPEGELLIDVAYSSLNYKDALSATGNPGVTRNFPHTPGIDAAGTVLTSASEHLPPGTEVIVIGFDLGMNTPGGFGQRIRVPSAWAVRMPDGLDVRSSMILGTAGFTAALCIDKLERTGMTPDGGPVLVTGSTGGVGSVAVKLLAKLGYEVHAGTGKAERHDYLRNLGASAILAREDLLVGAERLLGRETWGGVVDTVGGPILVNAVKSLRYGASAAACGLVASAEIPATVFPFILRHVNLLGIDSVELPLAEKARIWSKLAGSWKLDGLEQLVEPLALNTLSDAIDRILAGDMVGRGLVDPNA
ncbi:MAG: YhdH/YhfP family quinone oxidoreductase [Gammaproteobacteria bacterium]|nr:YhdH/YhfP family quinone oxidoreductase [Gammaproteobacteria bacterium]MDE0443189.1 YhdH/YhfP family quinone oxidoreductase [Gammaproteobacteria bacterium]